MFKFAKKVTPKDAEEALELALEACLDQVEEFRRLELWREMTAAQQCAEAVEALLTKHRPQ